jgi:hypothetical protein
VRSQTNENDDLEHGRLPDPEGQLIDELTRRLDQLEKQMKLVVEDKLSERQGV